MTPCLKTLFPCTGNSCRSQMTEGWARHLKGEMLEWMRYVCGRHHAPPFGQNQFFDFTEPHYSRRLQQIYAYRFRALLVGL